LSPTLAAPPTPDRPRPVEEPDPQRPSLRAFAGYFLALGAFGFGGPIALIGAMQRDLVERRRWVSREDYLMGLALAQLAPGPLAAQLAIYLGWVRARILGASVVAVAFILPSFAMVLGLSVLYVRLGGLPLMRGAFYGVAPAAIAIIARGAFKLVRMTLASDRLLWLVFAASAIATAASGREWVLLVLASGLIVLLARRGGALPALLGVAPAGWWITGLHGPANRATLVQLGAFFAAAGTFVFGSGLAIVPFLHGGVVQSRHWLDERQFLDAVAVAMITPGPVVITVAFIGYLVAGLAGAMVAAAGVFLPCYLLVIGPAPHFQRIARIGPLRDFVLGVTAAATGAIAGSVLVLARRAIVDVPSALIGAGALVALFAARRVPEPILILFAALAGLLIHGRG
jgi:chromate transporter